MITAHLIEEKHTFSQKYLDDQAREQTTSVHLLIDHRTKEFKVIPGDGRSEFGFVKGSHKYQLWQATIACMKAAMDFAIQTLYKPELEEKPVQEPTKVFGDLWPMLSDRARTGIIEAVAYKLDIRKSEFEFIEDWRKTVLQTINAKVLENVTRNDYFRVRNVGANTLNEIKLLYQNMKLVLKK